MIYYLLFGFILSLSINYLFLGLAVKLNYVDNPKGKLKIHKKPIPLSGGISLFFFIALTLLFLLLSKTINISNFLLILKIILIPGSIILLLGIIDDFKPVLPKYRLIIHTICSLLPIFYFVYSINLNVYYSIIYILLALVVATGIIVSTNITDGMDGLCGGLFLVTILGFIVINNTIHFEYFLYITAIALLGFLFLNFNPAKIFLGNSGSEFLGFIISIITLYLIFQSKNNLQIFLILALLGLPAIDMLSSILRRIINRKSITSGDRNHIYDRLLKIGLSQKKVWLIMMIIQISIVSVSLFFYKLS